MVNMSNISDKKPCPKCGKEVDYRSSCCWDCYWEREQNHCVDCGALVGRRSERCWECHNKRIAVEGNCCPNCGKSLGHHSEVERCYDCHIKHLAKTRKKWHCIDCGVQIKRRRKRCPECHAKHLKERGTYERTEEHKQKLSRVLKGKPKPWLRGKKRSPETRRKMCEYWTEEMRKEASKRWQGGNNPAYINGDHCRVYPREFNPKLRTKIRKRDQYHCQLCRSHFPTRSKALSIHHIDYDKMNNESINLIALCKSCHAKTNFHRQEWRAYFETVQALRAQRDFPLASSLSLIDISPPVADD